MVQEPARQLPSPSDCGVAVGPCCGRRPLGAVFAWKRWSHELNLSPMPRYFFHLESRNERIVDRRGQILPDERSAEREAVEVAVALRRRRGEAWGVIVTNESGQEVTQIPALE